MKASHFFSAALLGLGLSFSAHAQTPVVGAPGTMSTPGSPATPATNTGTIVPGQPGTVVPNNGTGPIIGTGTLPAGTTTPIGTSGTMSPNGMPTRNVDGGTLTPGQPMGTPGSQSTRRSNRTRTTTSGTTVRP
jgi:collagen type IV alpha